MFLDIGSVKQKKSNLERDIENSSDGCKGVSDREFRPTITFVKEN